MNTFMWAEIKSQGDNIRQVTNHLFGPERKILDKAADILRNGKPIMFIGMGSAEYLCAPAEHFLCSKGIFAVTVSASEAFYHLFPAIKNFNVVINSRSGETIEIVKLSEKLKSHHIPVIALTNEPSSTLARNSTYVIWANSRVDTLVSINIVTGMKTATLMLAAQVTNELDDKRHDFDTLADVMDGAIQSADEQAEMIADFFGAVRPIYLLYRGSSKSAATCGRLVLEEVARWPAVAMHAGEFRQGPIEVVDEGFGALVFASDGVPGMLNLSLAKEIKSYGGKVLVVGVIPEREKSSTNFKLFSLQSIAREISPVVEVVPSQVLAYKLAVQQGFTPGECRYISKIITTEEVSL